jgi:hypothetical protein
MATRIRKIEGWIDAEETVEVFKLIAGRWKTFCEGGFLYGETMSGRVVRVALCPEGRDPYVAVRFEAEFGLEGSEAFALEVLRALAVGAERNLYGNPEPYDVDPGVQHYSLAELMEKLSRTSCIDTHGDTWTNRFEFETVEAVEA